jgi:hypothetical protein
MFFVGFDEIHYGPGLRPGSRKMREVHEFLTRDISTFLETNAGTAGAK